MNAPMTVTSPPGPPRRRNLKQYQRRALTLLAGCGAEGCQEVVMRAHGFTADQLPIMVQHGIRGSDRRARRRDVRPNVRNHGASELKRARGPDSVSVRYGTDEEYFWPRDTERRPGRRIVFMSSFCPPPQ